MKTVRWFLSLTLLLVFASSTTAPAAAQAAGAVSTPQLKDARPTHGQRPGGSTNNPTRNGIAPQGDDDTAISLDPTLSSLCQSFINPPQLNVYNKPVPNVDAIVNDGTVAAGTQKGCGTAQNETTIAVNPANPRNLVSGTNDYRLVNPREGRNDGSGFAYTSFDGGKTWTNSVLPGLTLQTGATGALSDMDSAGDPVVAFGPGNVVYYANIAFSRFNGGSAITVNASHDGGLTWGAPSIVQLDGADANGSPVPTDFFNDKEWIGVDQRSGTVYVSWTRFGLTDSPIVVSASHDQGLTWSPFVEVNPASGFTAGGVTPYSQGSIPQVDKKGELFIAYESAVCQSLACDQPTDHDAVVVAKSTDGGQTFSNVEAALNFDFPFNPDTGRPTLTGENFRINSFPQFSIDPDSGRLYVVWADDRYGQYDTSGNSIKTNGDVFLVTSKDGANWSKAYRYGTSADEVYPAVAVNDGLVGVSFYTRAYNSTGVGLDYAYIKANGLSQLTNNKVVRITTQTSDPSIQFVGIGVVTGQVLQGVFIGDYTAVALGTDGVMHPSWTDFRGNPGVNPPNQDAYTQAIRLDK